MISRPRLGRRLKSSGLLFQPRMGLGNHCRHSASKSPLEAGKPCSPSKTVNLVNMIYLNRRTGLVLWIVPTTQIYRQTIKSLKDRDHPYRQHLDLASGGHTLILEKTDRFSSQDIQENLVVLMLMLPSANRQTKEVLRVFKDSGGFQDFFPTEDDIKAQEAVLKNSRTWIPMKKRVVFGENRSRLPWGIHSECFPL